MAPTAPGGRWFDEVPYMGGAFALQWALGWVNGTSGRISHGNTEAVDWNRVLAHRPILTADSVMGRVMPLYRSWLEHPVAGPFWARMEYEPDDFARIEIPTLTTTGWYDADQPGSLMYWRGLMAKAPDKNRHFLMIGPWEHEPTFQGATTKVGQAEFSPESVVDNKKIHLDFFEWCLKGSRSRFDSPRARIYVTGANVWRAFDGYPPARPRRPSCFSRAGAVPTPCRATGDWSGSRPRTHPRIDTASTRRTQCPPAWRIRQSSGGGSRNEKTSWSTPAPC